MTRVLKMGVVGAGVFGGYHAGKCAIHPRINFVGIYDPDQLRGNELADKHGVTAYKDYDRLLNDVEAVVIATPAQFHGSMAIKAFKAGCHALIEKPIAAIAQEAEEIIRHSTDKHLIVQVGHQERFVIKAIGLDRVNESPIQIIGHRHNTYSPRGTDVSVSLDLMTHDIDLAVWLMGEPPIAVSGEAIKVRSAHPDASLVNLIFSKGRTARLEASRVEDTGSREMFIRYPSGDVRIDFNAKTVSHSTPFDLDENFGNNQIAKDSLGAATNSFVEAVLDGKPISVSASAGLIALKTALRVDGVI